MIKTVICDRCGQEIREPSVAERLNLSVASDPMSLVHIPGYDGEYADRNAYIDLCPLCADAFHEFMKGSET